MCFDPLRALGLSLALAAGGCTPGQYGGAAMTAAGGGLMYGGFSTESSCTGDRPCYDDTGRRITNGTEPTRPRSIPVGIVGTALVVGGVALFVASPPTPKQGKSSAQSH